MNREPHSDHRGNREVEDGPPPEAAALIDGIARLLADLDNLGRVWIRVQGMIERNGGKFPPELVGDDDGAYETLPGSVTSYTELQEYKRKRRAGPRRTYLWAWPEALDEGVFHLRRCRAGISAARAGLPPVRQHTDSPIGFPADAWSAKFVRVLGQIGGIVGGDDGEDAATFACSLPAEFPKVVSRLRKSLPRLKSIPPPTPRKLVALADTNATAAGSIVGGFSVAEGRDTEANAAMEVRRAADHLRTLATWIPTLFPRKDGEWQWHDPADDAWSLAQAKNPLDLARHSWSAVECMDSAVRRLGITDSEGAPARAGTVGVWEDWVSPRFPTAYGVFAERVFAVACEIRTWHSRLVREMTVPGRDGIPSYRVRSAASEWARDCAARAESLAVSAKWDNRSAGDDQSKDDDLRRDSLRPAKWFSNATRQSLYADLLRVAVVDKRLVKSERLQGRWHHCLEEVSRLYPEYRAAILKAKESEANVSRAKH